MIAINPAEISFDFAQRVQGLVKYSPSTNYEIDANLMDLFPNLKVISNFGVGVNHIDIAAASERGIAVGNTPGVLADCTADMAFALLMASARNVVEGDRIARSPETKQVAKLRVTYFADFVYFLSVTQTSSIVVTQHLKVKTFCKIKQQTIQDHYHHYHRYIIINNILVWLLSLTVTRLFFSFQFSYLHNFYGSKVSGSTVGIVGLGRIGCAVAKRANGFDMKVLYHSRNRKEVEEKQFGELALHLYFTVLFFIDPKLLYM